MNARFTLAAFLAGLVILGTNCTEEDCSGSEEEAAADAGPDSSGEEVLTTERWTASVDSRIAINKLGEEPTYITTGHDDFKPVWSRTDSMLTFFRLLVRGADLPLWKTRIAVINVDGTGLKELTGGDFMDCNQTWTRDGSNQVIFNRLGYPTVADNSVYMIAPDGEPGDEQLISHPDHPFEWAFSALKDGRIFIERTDMSAPERPFTQSFLVTPSPGDIGYYEEITRPTDKQWHTLSVSPSETRVAYMLDNDDLRTTYADAVMYYADFDVQTLTISNPVQFAPDDRSYTDSYPRWTADEKLIVYSSGRSGSEQLYAYRMSDGTTHQLSPDDGTHSAFGNFETVPK